MGRTVHCYISISLWCSGGQGRILGKILHILEYSFEILIDKADDEYGDLLYSGR